VALVLSATSVAIAAQSASDDPLDALVATQRPAGGWTFASAPGTRPEPFTLVVKTAEHTLAPIGLATWDLVVVRSPGTPAAGLALVDGWRRTGRVEYLEAARRTGDFLVATQLSHGGWFSELPVEGDAMPWWFRWTADTRAMLDDDVTPGAVRLLLALWARPATSAIARRRARPRSHDRGAAPVRRVAARRAAVRGSGASIRTFEDQPALNDGATPFAITTLLAAAAALDRPICSRARGAAAIGSSSVQGAEPRAGWAQQYTAAGAPAGARAFEVPRSRRGRRATRSRRCWRSRKRPASARTASALRAARWLDAIRVGAACWARFVDPADGRRSSSTRRARASRRRRRRAPATAGWASSASRGC
jgi:hypothetical protein